MKTLSGAKLPERTQRCLNLVGATFHVPGDIIELGVSSGVTTIALARWIKGMGLDKTVYAFDTYEGLPYAGSQVDPLLAKGECRYEYSDFWKNVTEAGVQDIVVPVVGLVEETLPEWLQGHQVSFAFLDMDLYEPTSAATALLRDHLSLGGIIGYHDYGFYRTPGIKRVVDHELNQGTGLYRTLSDTAYDCAFMLRVK